LPVVPAVVLTGPWPWIPGAPSGSSAVALAADTAQSHPFFPELFLRGEVAVVEPFQSLSFDLYVQFPFNLADHVGVVGPGEGECFSGLLGPAGAPDAVEVGVGSVREVEVDNVGHFWDIDTVSGDVSGHHDIEFTSPEPVHRLLTGVLGHVPL
tara:strand:- start:199 stop:657 length:459 start_codon:yes stop_codon:yes gene_type:complete